MLLSWSAALIVFASGSAAAPWPAAYVAWGTAASGLLAGLLIGVRQSAGRWLATTSAIGATLLAAPSLAESPATALAASLALACALALLWNLGEILGEQPRRHPPLTGRARGAAAGALLLWSLVHIGGALTGPTSTLAADASLTVATLLAAIWGIRNATRQRRRALLVLAGVAATVATVGPGTDPVTRSTLAALLAALVVLVLPIPPRSEFEPTSWLELVTGNPERLFVGTFAFLCLLGAALLSLPQSAATGHRIDALDALFTSVSAVCVTGLAVLDTATSFSWFGQAVILALIQVGGLGIMTFSTAALRMLGHRISMRHEQAATRLISPTDRSRLYTTARSILVLTFCLEALGAVLLFPAFLAHGDSTGEALWRAVFTSVSAFCNAGFALQPDSLIPYSADPVVLHVVGALIIAGGLSPATVLALPHLTRRHATPLPTQVRINLAAAAFLLAAGFAFVAAFEWNRSLAGLDLVDRLHNAWFQSVTLRTAGFNSIDLTTVAPPTLTLMMLWMFIGGSPGGTAGGIKTTTATVLLLSVVQAVRGRWKLDLFDRRIAERTRHKASVTVTLAASTLILAIVAMQLTQTMPTMLAVFEVVSALGTVGLSLGGTAELDSIGKFIILMCMFIGRVGGLTALLFLSERESPEIWERPEEEIDVG